MNSLHSIPREIVNPFGLSDDQINAIRAFKRDFRTIGVGVWVNNGKAVAIGYDNRNGFDAGPRFTQWRDGAWLEIYDLHTDKSRFPAFDPAWITGVFHVT